MKILFMTVGTGVGSDEEKTRNLAHGLLSSIRSHRPDKVVFFGSEESMKTLEEMKRQYLEEENKELVGYEFVRIDRIDDFYECYRRMEDKIKEYKDDDIFIDYTSGTKTMTTSAAIVAMLYQKKLFLTTGFRGKNGVVKPGTEEAREQNLFVAYDKYLFDKAIEAFNSYRYEDARVYLKQIVALEDKDVYMKIVDAYDYWDKFDHRSALEKLRDVKIDIFNKNKSFLGRLNNERDTMIEEFLIPDLINNASRRMSEGKYDDAVARLYRCIEMIAQYRLKSKYGLNPSRIEWGDLETKLDDISKYEVEKDKDGVIRLALRKSYELLQDLRDDLGGVVEDKELMDLLTRRNSSILAHGVKPVSREDAEKLLGKTKSIAGVVINRLDSLLETSRFPRL